MSELISSGYSAQSAPNVIGWDRQPSWLVEDPETGMIYALGEEPEGLIGVFTRTSTGWQLVGTQPSLGSHPCHATLVGRTLVVAHYGDGVVSALEIALDGTLGPARIVVDESDGAHAHCVAGYGAEDVLLVDLGLAKVSWARLGGGNGDWTALGELTLDITTGPRHLALHPTLPIAYLITEYSNEIVSLGLGPVAGALKVLDRRSILPASWVGTSFGSGVRVSGDGKSLIAANRGHDSLVTFDLDSAGGLGDATFTPCGGTWPRDLVICADGSQVAVANQKSDAVAQFSRNPVNGSLVPSSAAPPLAVGGAAAVLFLREAARRVP